MVNDFLCCTILFVNVGFQVILYNRDRLHPSGLFVVREPWTVTEKRLSAEVKKKKEENDRSVSVVLFAFKKHFP